MTKFQTSNQNCALWTPSADPLQTNQHLNQDPPGLSTRGPISWAVQNMK